MNQDYEVSEIGYFVERPSPYAIALVNEVLNEDSEKLTFLGDS